MNVSKGLTKFYSFKKLSFESLQHSLNYYVPYYILSIYQIRERERERI